MVDKVTNVKLSVLGRYRSNYLAQYHVRELALLVKKSHVTLLPHLKSLEKDKILVSKKIGKNKVFSLNLDNMISKDYMLISEIIEAIAFLEQVYLIKKIFTEMLRLDGAIIIFGSYAKKSFKEDSDIDLFYIGEINEAQTADIKRIGKIYNRSINIKKSTVKKFERGIREKDPLILEIIKNHIILNNAEMFVNALWRYFHEK